jgi:hypothetical protein
METCTAKITLCTRLGTLSDAAQIKDSPKDTPFLQRRPRVTKFIPNVVVLELNFAVGPRLGVAGRFRIDETLVKSSGGA